MNRCSLTIEQLSWPLNRTFTISRGSKTSAEVIVVTLQQGSYIGKGECVPYARYGESCASVIQQIENVRTDIEAGTSRDAIQQLIPPGAARNAVDCALWDLACKRQQQSIWSLTAIPIPDRITTLETISIDTADKMAEAAYIATQAGAPQLKVKLDDQQVLQRIEKIRQRAGSAQLVIDANEAWTLDSLKTYAPTLRTLGVEMIEQPLPADHDQLLRQEEIEIPLCADESCKDRHSLTNIAERYSMINIKLDKTGGLTEALKLAHTAQQQGLHYMVGCMVGTSLAMTPGLVLAAQARFVDLDGPLWLAQDSQPPLQFNQGVITPPQKLGWGTPC